MPRLQSVPVMPRVAVLGLLYLFLAAASCQDARRLETLPALRLDDPAFPATAEAYAGPVPDGNGVDVLLNGDQIFPAKLAAIRGAKKTINYAEYFYADGPPARDIVEALVERCQAAVTVNVLLDGFGTLTMPGEYVERLKTAGCRVVTFRPVARLSLRRHNNRNHRRILVVDGRIGLTGGSGVSEKWMGNGRMEGHWRETDVRVEGPVVNALQAAFAENWREATDAVLGGPQYFPWPQAPKGDVRAQAVRSSPVAGSYAIYTMLMLAISSARRSILLTNPYFLPDERMAEALLAAARRGVRVIALTPGKIDHNIVRAASRRDFGRLLTGGIEIYEYQAALLHAKTIVVDGVWAAIGSTNFDNRSFALNDELDLVVYDRRVAGRLEKIFHEDLAHSKKVDYESWKNRGLKTKLLELFVIPLQDQL
jgi:cardiolipin synthase